MEVRAALGEGFAVPLPRREVTTQGRTGPRSGLPLLEAGERQVTLVSSCLPFTPLPSASGQTIRVKTVLTTDTIVESRNTIFQGRM